MLWIIITQINLLLGLVNDILDYKLIEENNFLPKNELFSLQETFRFILEIFGPHYQVKRTNLVFKAVPYLKAPDFDGYECDIESFSTIK